MPTPIFPAHIFNPGSVRTYIERRTLSGGVSLSGEEDQVIIDGGGRWVIEYADIGLDTPAELRAWDAWTGKLNAGTAEVLVPLLSIETAPRPALGQGFMTPSDLYTNDVLFPTEVRFQAPYIVAVLAESAALRATTLRITMQRGAPIMGGEKFSLGDRGYRIAERLGDDRYRIEPPLRASVTAGDPVNFDWPVVRCRGMTSEDEAAAPVILGRYSDAAIRFAEVVQ